MTGTVSEFRIDQDRLWLQVENEPLNTLLAHFSAAGINVEMDPGVQKSVSGNWQGVDLEKALGDLIVPTIIFSTGGAKAVRSAAVLFSTEFAFIVKAFPSKRSLWEFPVG
ncbi:hypothetical protein [Tichowtungia aerotolerans]|uniref:Uncharacterized protein n=1 Tax=Tichowtungia aerotolerans TaxID=2697043 RepID=A0A6P1MAN7_9BACT|nr:hypothetical protein [Tichowtungia aerotolerans]QHI68626.1 hypothetical protein GT409_03900 [Tichowtungia aerotolerans]